MLARRILRAPLLGDLPQPVVRPGDIRRVRVCRRRGEEFLQRVLAPIELLAAETGESPRLVQSRAVLRVPVDVLVERRERLGSLPVLRVRASERKISGLVVRRRRDGFLVRGDLGCRSP